MNIVQRLEANSTWEPNSGCRIWLGTLHREHGAVKVGGRVDHINGVRSDNRWCNLRLATQRQNSANQGLRTTNKSGIKGVSWEARRGSWRAQIVAGGKALFLGSFKTITEAKAARLAAEAEHHGDFARTEGTA
jgi:hypothetical protein